MDAEIIVSSRARRQWPIEMKVRIVEESYRADLSVLEVARRYDLDAAQIYQWRKSFGVQMQGPACGLAGASETGGFVAVSVRPEERGFAAAPPDATCVPPALSDHIEITLVRGLRISMPMSMDTDQIGRLVQALEKA